MSSQRTARMMDRVRTLHERREWLCLRIAEGNGSEGSLGYAAAECEALEWVIPIIEDMIADERVEARNVHRQRIHDGWRTTCKWAARHVYDDDPAEWERLVERAHPDVAAALRADLERCLERGAIYRDRRP